MRVHLVQDRPTSVVLVGDEEVSEYFPLGEVVEENPQHLMENVIAGHISECPHADKRVGQKKRAGRRKS